MISLDKRRVLVITKNQWRLIGLGAIVALFLLGALMYWILP